MKKAVYAGSFDPITNGHLWIIERGARLFDELIVAIGVNPDKSYTFTLAERVAFLKTACRRFGNAAVDTYENQFLVRYAGSKDAGYILRGIRNESDYEYERGMRHINSDLHGEIETVFLIPPRQISEISSSLIKGLIGPSGWEEIIRNYTPRSVYNGFLLKFNGLAVRWKNLCAASGVSDSDLAVYEEIKAAYGAPARHYHNLMHIADCFRLFDKTRDTAVNVQALELAIFFHDFVYDSRSTRNEEESAQAAKKLLSRLKMNKTLIDAVVELIMATKNHQPKKDADAAILCDIDLVVLALPGPEFAEFDFEISEEYGHVPQDEFKKKRKEFFGKLLDRQTIYATDHFRSQFEKSAQANLKGYINH